jgi:hypothetical protein
LISSEYGWSDEYIWTLTTRRVDHLIGSIVKRRNLRMEFEALLSDKKIKLPNAKVSSEPLKIDQKQEEAIELAHKMAQKRMSEKYKR